jgi:hypothetical protein
MPTTRERTPNAHHPPHRISAPNLRTQSPHPISAPNLRTQSSKELAMHRRALSVSLLAFASALGAPAMASAAGSQACGDVDLSSLQQCTFEWSGGCEAACGPASFVLACEAQCNASISVACSSECRSECLSSCTIDPGQFDCEVSCAADCQARAETTCGCGGQSTIEIEASCAAECQAQCTLVPPSAPAAMLRARWRPT